MIEKKTTAVAKAVSAEQLAELNEGMAVDAGFTRVQLPRIGLNTQDKFEGKGKLAKLVAEAGMYFTDVSTDEIDEETGKNRWEKTNLGQEMEAIIVYQRRQLRSYDESTEKYTSSPIYDSNDETVVLFCDKVQVNKGLPADLKKEFMYINKKGKKMSSLEENKILYVLYDGVLYQMTIRGSSLWGEGGFTKYAQKHMDEDGNSKIASFVTKFGSIAREKGEISWNQMTLEKVRDLTSTEAKEVIEKKREILESIKAEKDFYAGESKEDKLNAYVKDAKDAADEDFKQKRISR